MEEQRSRRSALKALGAAAVAPIAAAHVSGLSICDQGSPELNSILLEAIAEAALPTELGADGPARVVNDFLRWIREYRQDAEMDHGYGFTRIRTTGASPVSKYSGQLEALNRAAAAVKPGVDGPAFVALDLDARRAVIAAALKEAKVERLPQRPTGAHVAADLMGFYFNSSAAADLCYRARIGRDECRGLDGSEKPPAALNQ